MKVVQVLPRLHSGGVERGTIEIARFLKQAGHDAVVISEGGPLESALRESSVIHLTRAVGTKSFRAVLGFWQLRSYFKEAMPDIVHGRSRLPDWLCYFAVISLPKATRPKLVTSVHGLHSISWYSRIITKGELIETVSHAARDYLLENYRDVDQRRVRVIHRGIDPTLYHSKFEPSQAWKQKWNVWCQEHCFADAPTVAIVGRISRLKGHHDFLSTLEMLLERNFLVNGLIIGDVADAHQGLLDELKQRVEHSKLLQTRVFFLGQRKDVRELMAVSSVVVSFSSTPEAFGRTVLEALSLGVPVVGYDHGGAGELLKLLFPVGTVPVGDTEFAVERIRTVVSQSFQIPLHSFTLQAMCEKTLAMYQELLV